MESNPQEPRIGGPASGSKDKEDFWSVRRVVKRIRKTLHTTTAFGLPSKEVELTGEVLRVRSGAGLQYLTLLDGKEADSSICATLPLDCPRPEIGAMVTIRGRFDHRTDENCVSVQIRFSGSSIPKTPYPSARRREMAKALGEVREQSPSARTLVGQPKRVHLVTSSESKAVADFKAGLERKKDLVDLRLTQVRLNDAADIVRGLKRAEADGADLIAVIRGGGSPVDLVPFDNIDLMKTVAEVAARVPVLVAVGHKEDHTPADAVASYSFSTPFHAGIFVARNFSFPSVPPIGSVTPAPTPAETADTLQILPAISPWKARFSRVGRWLLRALKLLLLGAALFGAGWCARGLSAGARMSTEHLQIQPSTAPAKGAARHR
jgi:exonuclease VII large subunit